MRWRKDKRPGLPPAIDSEHDPDLEPDSELDSGPDSELGSEPDGTVVDLAAARTRRAGDPDGRPDSNPAIDPDTCPDSDADMSDADPDDDTDIDPDSGPDDGPVLVDTVEAQREPSRWQRPGLVGEERRPILPPWLTSRSEFVSAARWLAGYVGHTLAYHAVRVPKYVLRLLFRAPRGAVRLVGGWSRWLFDLSGEPVRQAAVRREDAKEYLALTRVHDRHVRWRGIVTTAAAILVVPAIIVAAWWAPEWARWVALAVAVAGLGLLGRPEDKPLLDTAVVVTKAQKLTSEVVVRALCRTLPAIATEHDKRGRNGRSAVNFTAPISRDGPGWRADVDLPAGVTATEVIDRREKLAAALSRPLGCVWPETNHDIHPGRLVLWVADQDMATVRQPAWPLARSGTVDLFKPFPFGTDQRGRVVMLDLDGTNMLLGSIPGYGKTRADLIPLLAAALDPHAEIWDYDLKGVGDHKPISRVAARYVSGNTDEHIEAALQGLRDLRADLQRRQKVLDGLSDRECPEGRVTPELTARKSLGLHQKIVNIDEAQELFSHPDFGKEAGELAEKNIRLGRALNVKLILATQRPDARSLPTGVTANVGTRFCLRVMDQTANDMVLGTSQYKNGIRATMFTPKDKGVGWLVGAGAEPQIVRTYFVDGPAANKIIDRAVAAREKAGTLTGYAAGEPNPTPDAQRAAEKILDDILAVLPAAEPKIWTEQLLDRLAAHRPDLYADIGRDELVAMLRRHDITTKQVWGTTADGKGANRRGIDRADITEVITHRNRQRGDRSA